MVQTTRHPVRSAVRCLGAALVGWGIALCAGSQSIAGTLGDGPGGMTCQFFDAGAMQAWARPGGDWVDATGRLSGDAAFAQVEVRLAPTPQWLEWDLRKLVESWDSAKALPGLVALRALASHPGGAVTLTTREHADHALRPQLILKWRDGITQRLAAAADTFLSCPTYASQGHLPEMHVGDTRTALLAFAYQPRPGQSLTSAKLLLHSPKQYGAGADVGVFGLRLPVSTEPDPGPGLARAWPQDRGLAGQPGVLYVQDFETATAADFAAQDPSTRASLRIVDREEARDPAGFSPLAGKALSVTVRKGTQTALNHHLRFAKLPGGEPEAAYFRYYLRLGDNWNPTVDGGKMPGFAGTYGRAGWGQRPVDGRNGWSARGGFLRTPQPAADGKTDESRALTSYTYQPTAEAANGVIWGWNLGLTGSLQKHRWYSIEQYIRLNQPGRSDGQLNVWVDGKPVLERSGLRFRDVPELRIESVWLNIFHGGMSNTDRDLTLFIDNLVIAKQYIGPGNFPVR